MRLAVTPLESLTVCIRHPRAVTVASTSPHTGAPRARDRAAARARGASQSPAGGCRWGNPWQIDPEVACQRFP